MDFSAGLFAFLLLVAAIAALCVLWRRGILLVRPVLLEEALDDDLSSIRRELLRPDIDPALKNRIAHEIIAIAARRCAGNAVAEDEDSLTEILKRLSDTPEKGLLDPRLYRS